MATRPWLDRFDRRIAGLGCVLYPHMDRGQWAATTEFKVNHLNPVTTGRLVAEARSST